MAASHSKDLRVAQEARAEAEAQARREFPGGDATSAAERRRFERAFLVGAVWAASRPASPATREAAFDRWLAAHDEAVRQEERERCARIVENAMTEVGYAPGPGETAVANPPIRRMSDVAARIREGGEQDR